jgi:inward rectifier potassium channel
MSPSNLWVNIGASFEAFMGLIFFAIATGLVYGRFTSSKADIRFSKNIIINKSTEEPHLKLRLANFSNSDLSDLNAIIITSYIERVGNQVVRRYKKTPLELQHISLLTTSWTLIHKIGQDSPCSQLLTTNHVQGLEFLIFITAFDEIYDQKIKVRTSYTHKDIIYSAHFKPITSYDTEKALVNLDDLSSFEKI